jgi:hypothetical protein
LIPDFTRGEIMPVETIKTKHDIFISYRRNGGLELAEKIYDALCDKFAPFFDKNSMRSGDFDKQIYTAIEECEDFILIISPNALDERESEHDWMRIEIKHARDNGKNIIPIAFDDFKFSEILPDEIKEINRLQQICYTGDDAKLVYNVKDFLRRYKDGRVLAEYAESMYATYNKLSSLTMSFRTINYLSICI